MKKITFFILLILLFSLFFSFIGAQEEPIKTLEVEYPEIRDIKPVYAQGEGLPDYVIYIIQLLIFLAGGISIISLVGGGVVWLTSMGDPGKVKDAKERISSAIFGIIIVFSSSLFLSSIDPSLLELEELEVVEVEESFPSGIYLSSQKNITEKMVEEDVSITRLTSPERNLEKKGESVQTLLIANPIDERGDVLGYYYGVVLHEKQGFRGRCEFYVNEDPDPVSFQLDKKNISSISVIKINRNPLGVGSVTAYEKPDFREDYPFEKLKISVKKFTPLSIGGVWSIDIEGSYAVILSSGSNWEETEDGCGVFLDSKPISDLKGHHMNLCNPRKETPIYAAYDSCSTHYIVLPLY